MNFSELLLNFRASHGLSQKELASLLKSEQSSISMYESGKREPNKVNKIIIEKKLKEYEENKKGDVENV